MRSTTTPTIQALDIATRDAYSYERYGSREWTRCVKLLIQEWAFTPREAEAILRSKWMRWAADSDTATAVALSAWLSRELTCGGFARFRADVEALVDG